MTCWIPITAECPHCRESLRQVGGQPYLRALIEARFRSRHFDRCPHKPALAITRKEPACLSTS